jgi:PilZ domain-containing protein
MNRLMTVEAKASAGCRRKSMRWPVDFPLWHWIEGASLVAGCAVDLSEEGLAFRGARDYAVGSTIRISLDFAEPSNPLRQVSAIVRHSSKGVTGVEFVNLPEAEKQRVLEIIYAAIAARRR